MDRQVTPNFKTPPTPPDPYAKSQIGADRIRADKLHADLVKDRDGRRCLRCPNREGLEIHCAHIFRRGHLSTRFDMRNSATLCARCHEQLTLDHGAHVAYFRGLLGDDLYDELERLTGVTIDGGAIWWAEHRARLERTSYEKQTRRYPL